MITQLKPQNVHDSGSKCTTNILSGAVFSLWTGALWLFFLYRISRLEWMREFNPVFSTYPTILALFLCIIVFIAALAISNLFNNNKTVIIGLVSGILCSTACFSIVLFLAVTPPLSDVSITFAICKHPQTVFLLFIISPSIILYLILGCMSSTRMG